MMNSLCFIQRSENWQESNPKEYEEQLRENSKENQKGEDEE